MTNRLPTFPRRCIASAFLRLVLLAATALGLSSAKGADVSEQEQAALAAAVDFAAPAVVQIRTIGGLEQVDDHVLSQGPTSGVVVRADGYIVSSAFNFAQRPSSIIVRLPDGSQRPAKLVGRDYNRMLVLLKIETDGEKDLPTAQPAELDDVRVGVRAIALGRTYDSEHANVSLGVVSAKNRMLGRAVQTDAKVSAANYGGALIDLRGRVIGVLVPMAPSAPAAAESSELAGAEYYDSGIAFAVPLESILAQLDSWIAAGDLHRGLLGVGLAAGPPHMTEPRVTSVWPGSPAEAAGWKAGDLIVAVAGQAVTSQTQLRIQTAPRNAGDAVSFRLRRGTGDKAKEFESSVTLIEKMPPFRGGFLGVLPLRKLADKTAAVKPASLEAAKSDDKKSNAESAKAASKAGLAIRGVWPDSPADDAGLKSGDVLLSIGDTKVADATTAAAAVAELPAKKRVSIAFARGGEPQEADVELESLPTAALAKRETLADEHAAGDPDKESAAGHELVELKLPEFAAVARCLLPGGDDATEGRPGLLIWLGGRDAEVTQALAASWAGALRRARVVLVVAEPGDAAGWTGDDLEYLARLLPTASQRFHADPRRTVVAGEAKAGQMALALALKARGHIAGVAAVAAPLPRTATVPDNVPGMPLAVLTIATENSPFSALVKRDAARLAEAGFPVTEATRRASTDRDGLLDAEARELIARWLESLDRF